MSWIYKSRNKVDKKDLTASGELVPICPKCHYILMVRDGERPLYCPMCGNKNLTDTKEKRGK